MLSDIFEQKKRHQKKSQKIGHTEIRLSDLKMQVFLVQLTTDSLSN